MSHRFIFVAIIYLKSCSIIGNANQYLVLGKDGAYKYGYATNDNDIVARQEGDSKNQVSGHYYYRDGLGRFGVKYTSGVQGFVPEKITPNNLFYLEYPYPQGIQSPFYSYPQPAMVRNPSATPSYKPLSRPIVPLQRTDSDAISGQLEYPFHVSNWYPQDHHISFKSERQIPYDSDARPIKDASYRFSFDTGNYRRNEASDSSGNVEGYYAYENDAGLHDLSYVADDPNGFRVTGGSLASMFPGYIPQVSPPISSGVSGVSSFSYNNEDTVAEPSVNVPIVGASRKDGKTFLNREVSEERDITDVPVLEGERTEKY